MAAGEEDTSVLSRAKALITFVERGKVLLEVARKESKEGSLEDFIRKRIRIERNECMLGLIEAGAVLYKSLSVRTKNEAEELWKSGYQCSALRDAVEDLMQLAVEWDAFLEYLDGELHLSVETLEPGPQARFISPETPLVNAKTGEALTLERYFAKGEKILLVLIRQFSCLLCRLHLKDLEANQRALDALSVRVLVVSFGCQEGALNWIQETGCQYDMLLDPDRQVYRVFGLGASLKKVLNFDNMLIYAEYVVADMEFPRGLPSIEDDMFQLGGDFLLDEHGKVLLSHCCQSPIDRPSVDDILAAS